MKNVLLIFISQYIVVVAGTKQELNTCMLKTKPWNKNWGQKMKSFE